MTRADHPGLVSRVFDAIQQKYLSFGMDMQEMYDAYADAYEDAFRDLDAEERDARIREEICADCYAGRGFGDWGQEEMRFTAQAAAREVTGESYRDVRPEATQTQLETREGGRNMALDDETEENHFTMDDVNTLRQIGDRKSVVDFSGEDIKKAEPWARMFYHGLKEKSPFFRAWFGDWRIQDKTSLVIPEIDISAQRNSGNAINRDIGRKMSWDRGFLGETLLYTNKQNRGKITALCANIEEIVKDSILFDTRVSEKNSKRKMDGIAFMHSFYALVHYQDQTILVKMFPEEAVSPKTGEDFIRSYMLRALEEVADLGNSVHSDFGGLTEPTSATSIYTVSDLFDLVKRYDKDFRYSEPSKVVNEDGTPKVVYHQTSGDFWTFDNSNPAAGANDSETPNGYFFKDNDHDIGLGGRNTTAITLKNHISDIEDMTPVSTLSGKEMNDRSKNLQTQIREFFDSVGEK